MKLPRLDVVSEYSTFVPSGGYLGQMCNIMVDILGKCAISWWISWADVQYHGGYLGQMCNIMVDIMGRCAISWWISWANVQYHGGYHGQTTQEATGNFTYLHERQIHFALKLSIRCPIQEF